MVKTETKEKSYNRSTTFILPMLSKPWVWYGNKLINTYLFDKEHPQYNSHIFVLLDYEDDDEFIKLEQNLRAHPHYVFDYDPDPRSVMFVFSVPDEFQEDYNLFKEGKYSRFSARLKHAILGPSTSGLNYDILTRSPKRKEWMENILDVKIDKDAELYGPPDLNKETF